MVTWRHDSIFQMQAPTQVNAAELLKENMYGTCDLQCVSAVSTYTWQSNT